MQEQIKCIVFRLAQEEFGVDVAQVRSIERVQSITYVPKAPSFVKGVINLRGSVIPVIDLRERLSMNITAESTDTRLIIVHVLQQDVAFVVDAANDVTDIDRSSLEPAPATFGSVDIAYIYGVAKLKDKLLILLNLENILAEHEALQAAEIARV